MSKKLPITIFNCKTIAWLSAFSYACTEINKLGGTVIINFNGISIVNNKVTKLKYTTTPDAETVTINQPEEDTYEHLDSLFSAQWREHTFKNHGVEITEKQAEGPHSIARIARALVTSVCGFYYEPGYSSPELPKLQTIYDILCLKGLEDYAEIVQKQGEYPSVYYYDNNSDIETLEAFLSNPKIIITYPSSPLNTLIKGMHKGPDFNTTNPLVLSVVRSNDEDSGRYMINLSSLYYVNGFDDNSETKNIDNIIKEYVERLKYNFSHVEYLKKEKPGASL